MKDAKGHGSDARGGGVGKGDASAYAKRLGLRPEIASAITRAARSQPVSNAQAAAALASGPKSAPVGTHSSMSGEKPFNLATLNKTYNRNENNNFHSENIALLAKNFGSPAEHAQAKEIIAARNKQGSLPSSTQSVPNVREWQYGIHKKYIGKLTGE